MSWAGGYILKLDTQQYMGDIFAESQNKPELLDHMFILLAEPSKQNETATIIIMIVRLGKY